MGAIVEAVRTGSLVDRMPAGTRVRLRPVPKVDYRTIFMIWHDARWGFRSSLPVPLTEALELP